MRVELRVEIGENENAHEYAVTTEADGNGPVAWDTALQAAINALSWMVNNPRKPAEPRDDVHINDAEVTA